MVTRRLTAAPRHCARQMWRNRAQDRRMGLAMAIAVRHATDLGDVTPRLPRPRDCPARKFAEERYASHPIWISVADYVSGRLTWLRSHARTTETARGWDWI
ncbi:hypothetical protein EVAR_89957_1 [Eumeta japonica]|uniref:Uncharacterized protein n=1 Tax=Eumeta variegata TaxID=151549 RepID=A0A4C2AA37_EUMVA|nr:hypothetical protein EVAR_89957_1 [Eumeta japonica]